MVLCKRFVMFNSAKQLVEWLLDHQDIEFAVSAVIEEKNYFGNILYIAYVDDVPVEKFHWLPK